MSLKNEPLSFSSLSRFAQSPLAFVHYKTAPRTQTPAMLLGTLVHRRILEPEEYTRTVVVWDGARRGSDWKEFAQEHVSSTIITRAESDKIEAITDSVRMNRTACNILGQCTDRELQVKWTHEGVAHRGYVDACGPGIVVDLKVTQSVSERDLQRVIYERRYYMQAAMYMHGLEDNGWDMEDAYIIAVESQAPHHVRVCQLPPHYIVRGHHEWVELVDRFRDWDGIPNHTHDGDGVTTIDAPSWAPVPNGIWGDQRTRKGQTV